MNLATTIIVMAVITLIIIIYLNRNHLTHQVLHVKGTNVGQRLLLVLIIIRFHLKGIVITPYLLSLEDIIHKVFHQFYQQRKTHLFGPWTSVHRSLGLKMMRIIIVWG